MTDFDTLWNYDDPADTEQQFRALLPQLADDPAQHAELLTQIARTFSLRRMFDEAHSMLDEANSLISNSQSRAYRRYLLERGRTFNSAQQRERASELFGQAWDLACATGEDFYVVDAAHMLGISEPPEKQSEWNLRALEHAEASADPRAQNWRGSLYNNLGWTYHTVGDYATALDLFERALKFRRERGQANETRIVQWSVARCLRSLNRLEEALFLQTDLLAELERASETDGYVFEELGECLLALERAAKAQPYFAQAHAVLSQDAWLAENEPARLERLKTLSQARE